MSAAGIYNIKELTQEQKAIIKATIRTLELSGTVLTSKFYKFMIDNNLSVIPFFNKSNQETMRQPKILAFALLHYDKPLTIRVP